MDLPAKYVLKARFVLPIDASPIEDGVIEIEQGRIRGIWTSAKCHDCFDLGHVAVLPGLINAHAHLEFSDLTAPLGEPGMPLPDWIECVLEYRQTRGLEPIASRIGRGIRESLRYGTTTIGEIASQPCDDANLPVDAIDLVVFLELIGRDRDRVQATIDAAQRHVNARNRWCAGLSPHAPYTIDDELLSQAVGMAAGHHAPLAIHLAESREELQWLRDGSGRLAEMLARRGGDMAQPASFDSPLDVIRHVAAAPKVLLIHGNYLDSSCVEFVAKRPDRISVVYCPRTHAYFGHDRNPLEVMIERGVNIALGTDGRSSNSDLSLLAELRHVRAQFPHLPARDVLRLGTINGARALGCDADCGTLAPGKLANLAVVGLPDDGVAADPAESVLDSDVPNLATIHHGKLVYDQL